ncbi:MAG: hypothetical protein MJZ29_08870 [Bacteroidaceae bacterium]|nr:hypothetical protein [Bacteroidaceae bacterium]
MRKLLLSLACAAVATAASAQTIEAQAQLDKSLTLHESYTKAGPLVSTSSSAATTKKKAAADGVYFQTQGMGWVWSERPLYSYNRPYQVVPALTELVWKNMSTNKTGDWFILNEGNGNEIDLSKNVDENGDLHLMYSGGEGGYYAPSYRVGDVTYIPSKAGSTYRNEVSDLSLMVMFPGNLDGAKYYGGGVFDNGNLYGAGTYQGLTSVGVYMRLPKPASPLYVENLSVWGCLGKNISIEEGADPLAGQTLVAAIYNVEDEEAEPVYLTCTAEECKWDRATYYILHFTQKVLDEASGEMVETPFVIDYEAEVDLLGFDQEGVVVGIMGPEVPAEFVSTFIVDGEDELYYQGNMIFTDGEKDYSMAYNGCTSVAVAFNAVFDKIDVWEDDETEEGEAIKINGIQVSEDGTESSNCYYGLNKGAFVQTALDWFATDADGNPTGEEKYWSDDMYDYEWIQSLTAEYNEDLDMYEVSATCDALPAGAKRYAKIHVVGRGAESSDIYVLQGMTIYEAMAEEEAAGINNATATVKAQANGTFNLAGQRVNKEFKGVAIQNGKKVVKK